MLVWLLLPRGAPATRWSVAPELCDLSFKSREVRSTSSSPGRSPGPPRVLGISYSILSAGLGRTGSWRYDNHVQGDLMPSYKPIAVVLAAVALGSGLGAGVYAALDPGNTQTIIRETAAVPVSATTTTSSVNSVYEATRDAVVEITVTGAGQAIAVRRGRAAARPGLGLRLSTSRATWSRTSTSSTAPSRVTVTFRDGSRYDATVVGSDPSTDLAVIKVDAPASELSRSSSATRLGPGRRRRDRDRQPLRARRTVTDRIVSALGREIDGAEQLRDRRHDPDRRSHQPRQLAAARCSTSKVRSSASTPRSTATSGGNDGVGFAIPSNTVRRSRRS